MGEKRKAEKDFWPDQLKDEIVPNIEGEGSEKVWFTEHPGSGS